jgi:hypothetical protein
MPISKELKSYLREAWVNYRIWLTGSLALFLFSIFNAFWFQNKLPFVVVYTIATLGLVRVLVVDGLKNYKKLRPQLSVIKDCFIQYWNGTRSDGSPVRGVEWYIELWNNSGVSIYDIKVELHDTIPHYYAQIKPPLHVQHHEDDPTTVFVLHPDGKQRIGLVRGQDGESSIWVKHTLPEQNLTHVIPGTKCRLIVSATGKDIPQLKTVFATWIDENGKLQCQKTL